MIETELKSEQDKVVKLETLDLSIFFGQSYFVNDGAQLYLIFQRFYCTLKRLGDTEKVVSSKSKDFLAEKLTTPITTENILSRSVNATKIEICV